MTEYLFTPPTVETAPIGIDNAPFHRYKLPRGITVVKLTDGSFYQARHPALKDLLLDEVETVYLGGHRHLISEDEKNDLEDAGYGEFIEEA